MELVDADGKSQDSVSYASEGDWATRVRETTWNGWGWSTLANGGGRSIEVRNPNVSNDNGQNWIVSSTVGGTPGAANDVLTADIPPIVKAVKHSPAVPKTTDTVIISCELNDEFKDDALQATVLARRHHHLARRLCSAGHVGGQQGHVVRPHPAQGQPHHHRVLHLGDRRHQHPHLARPDGARSGRQLPVSGHQRGRFHHRGHLSHGAHRVGKLRLQHGQPKQRPQVQPHPGSPPRSGNEHPLSLRHADPRKFQPQLSVQAAAHCHPGDDPLDGSTGFNFNPRASFLQYFGMRMFRAAGLRAPDTVAIELRRNGVESTSSSGGTADYGLWVRMEDWSSEFIDAHWPLADGGQRIKKAVPTSIGAPPLRLRRLRTVFSMAGLSRTTAQPTIGPT